MSELEIPEAKRVHRADLRSESPSERSNSDVLLQEQLKDQLSRIYDLSSKHLLHNEETKLSGSPQEAEEQIEHDDAEEYEFNLFARPMEPSEPSTTRNRIVLRSPTPPSRDRGFVVIRPNTFYFTGQSSRELQEQYRQATVSGDELARGLKVKWPGCELPWRVVSVKAADAKKAVAAVAGIHMSNIKRRRCGKKRRIAIRKKTARRIEKERLAKASQQDKEATEKEKRTRRNREKKVKRRQKEKIKKGFPQYFPPGVLPSSGGAAYQVAQCNNAAFIWYCCDGDGSGSCCNDLHNDLKVGDASIAFIASSPTYSRSAATLMQTSKTSNAATQSVTLPNAAGYSSGLGPQAPSAPPGTSSTVTASSQQTASPSSSSISPPFATLPPAAIAEAAPQSNHTVVVGASTGGAIAAFLLVSGIFACLWIRRRPPQQQQQQQKQQHQDPEKQVYRATANTQSSRAITSTDWGEATLIDSYGSPSTPTPYTSNATHEAAELDSPTIQHLVSIPPPSLAPTPLNILTPNIYPPSPSMVSPLSLPSTFTRPAEVEDPAFDITPIHPQSPPLSSHSSTPSHPPHPPPSELEARDGVTISTLYKAASGSTSNLHRPTPPTRGSPLSTILQSPHSSVLPRGGIGASTGSPAGASEPSGWDKILKEDKDHGTTQERNSQPMTVQVARKRVPGRKMDGPPPTPRPQARHWGSEEGRDKERETEGELSGSKPDSEREHEMGKGPGSPRSGAAEEARVWASWL